jgi:hypothetical protein
MYAPKQHDELAKDHNARINDAMAYFEELDITLNNTHEEKSTSPRLSLSPSLSPLFLSLSLYHPLFPSILCTGTFVSDRVEACIAIASVDRAPHKYPTFISISLCSILLLYLYPPSL